jgi:hypothetical protein
MMRLARESIGYGKHLSIETTLIDGFRNNAMTKPLLSNRSRDEMNP